MTEEELRVYLDWAVPDYVDEVQRNTGIDRATAVEHAARSIRELLPEGLATRGHRLFLAVDPGSGERIGLLWVARQTRGPIELLWIYDILVDEPFRGRGYGRRLMELVEEEARDMGLQRIELNVFADNARARGLYESIGFRESSRQMYKELGVAGPG
jgi:ribosomal protein S18 acetylase RimI-like enzyme